jgi:hypothetical protein
MNRIQAYARSRLADLPTEPLFHELAGDVSASRTLQILPYVTFWSNVFQDIIALNLQRVVDPQLRSIVQTHYDEDRGHNVWLAADVRLIYGALPDVLATFDPAYLPAREFSYAFMAEVYRAESDWERVTLPIVLEEGGKIFLPALIDHFARRGLGPHLQALGHGHVQTEADHQLHTDGVAAALGAMQLPEDARIRAMAMIDRCRAVFGRFAGVLHDAITTSRPEEEMRLRRRVSDLVGSAA